MTAVSIHGLDDIRVLVRSERKRRGLDQKTAAGMIGHTRKWLSDFERGATSPPTDMVLKLMILLGIKLYAEVATENGSEGEEIGLEVTF